MRPVTALFRSGRLRWPVRWRRWLLAVLAVPVILLVVFMIYVRLGAYPVERLEQRGTPSMRIFDRHGNVLREFSGDESRFHLWIPLRDVSEAAREVFLFSEDRDFYAHGGVDHPALLRALWQNLTAGHVVSGASTVTMQLVRLVHPRPRTFFSKFQEVVDAYRLERVRSKDQILEQYLNRLPFSHGAVGIEAGSRVYFQIPASRLSLAQAAFLAVIPRSPVRYDPRHTFERVKTMQVRLLRAMIRAGVRTREATVALSEPVTLKVSPPPFFAPHFTRALHRHLGEAPYRAGQLRSVRSTLDLALQRRVESIVTRELVRLRGRNVTNAAVVIVDNASGDLLTYVGSASYWDRAHQGAVDGVTALRQPGSTLKPFTYALALQRGFTAASILPDIPTDYRLRGEHTFSPRNYSGHFLGPVRLRNALAASLNVPAVYVAGKLGYRSLLDMLLRLGFSSLSRHSGVFGLGITLGNGEVSLLALASAYATMARGGVRVRPRYFLDARRVEGAALLPDAGPGERILSPEAAWLITHILQDPMARVAGFGFSTPFAFPYPVAVKTGTSSNFRDNLAVAYTREVTVAVWVGNFDGSPMEGMTGTTGAGPILHGALLAAMEGRVPVPMTPPGTMLTLPVCALSGLLPGPLCAHTVQERFIPESQPRKHCDWHEEVALDRRNMLLAGPGCSGGVVLRKVFPRYPADYAAWIRDEGIAVAPERWSPHCPGTGRAPVSLEIVSPRAGAHYLIDPTEPLDSQQVALRVRAEHSVLPGMWRVDGKPLAPVPWPYTLHWRLVPGTHVFRLRVGSAVRSITITVR